MYIDPFSAIQENFDFRNDEETLKIITSVTEAGKTTLAEKLCEKLYQEIVSDNNLKKIDFGDIPNTKGDVTKLKCYEQLCNCIDLISDILQEYKQDTSSINIIIRAKENLIKNTELFKNSFANKVEMGMLLYCTSTLSMISSVSFLISGCVEFFKTASPEEFEVTINKVALTKSKDNQLFRSLNRFNSMCEKDDLDHTIGEMNKNASKNFAGASLGVIAGVTAIYTLITSIIPLLREFVFWLYSSRARMSDHFRQQSELLSCNIERIQDDNTIDPDKKVKIISRQKKYVERFTKVADALDIDSRKADKKAEDLVAKSNKKYKVSDITDELPEIQGSIF